MARKMVRWLLIILLIFLLYVAVGALAPFVHMKDVSENTIMQYQKERFDADENPVDRAALAESSQEALDVRIHMLNSAKERIVLSTFDIRPGRSAEDVFAVLVHAADQGVKVQLLVDGLYGTMNMSKEMKFLAAGMHPNIEIRFYNVPNLLKPWTINGRMHDKYILVDDKLLLMGGRNTFDYFLGNYNKQKLSYDRDVFLYNSAAGTKQSKYSSVHQIEAYFEQVWNSSYCQTVFKKAEKKEDEAGEALMWLQNHYKEMKQASPDLFQEQDDYTKWTVPVEHAELLTNPIGIYGKEPVVFYELCRLMEEAKDRVYIHTPYAAFSKDMYAGIQAVSQNVEDVKLLINSPAVGDNFMASSDYIHNKEKIIDTGASIYEFQGDHSSHGKSVLIDQDLSVVGSYNFDMRSTYVDTETMLVIRGKEFNQLLEEKLVAMEEKSLLVKEDGSYTPKDQVEPVVIPTAKKLIFAVTSRVFQLFRYLI